MKRLGLAILLLSGSASFADSPAKPSCHLQDIFLANKAELPDEKSNIAMPDGGAFANPFFLDTQSRNESAAQRRARLTVGSTEHTELEIRAIFESAQAALVRTVSQKRPAEDLSEGQRLMIDHLKNVHLEFVPAGFGPADYVFHRHAIALRPEARKIPRYALFVLLAHELGHSVDLCNLGSTFYGRGSKESNLGDLAIGPLPQQLQKYLNESSAPETEFILDTVYRGEPGYFSHFKKLVNDGHFVKRDGGIPYEKNPLRNVMNCFKRKGRSIPELEADACFTGDRFLSEEGAQVWAARALSIYIKASPPKTLAEKLSIFSLGLPAYFGADSKISKRAVNEKEKDFDEIFFSEPNLQKLFGCTQEVESNCMAQFEPCKD